MTGLPLLWRGNEGEAFFYNNPSFKKLCGWSIRPNLGVLFLVIYQQRQERKRNDAQETPLLDSVYQVQSKAPVGVVLSTTYRKMAAEKRLCYYSKKAVI
jgi:hypothetical protein